MAEEVPKPSVEAIAQRLDSMDRAIVLIQDSASRMPTPAIVMEHVGALKELTAVQFASLEKLMNAMFDGNQIALAAALKTQKEASDKIESNFSKQFESINNIVEAKTKALDEKIGDNKDRITSSESHSKGLGDGFGYVIGAIGVVIAVATFIATRT